MWWLIDAVADKGPATSPEKTEPAEKWSAEKRASYEAYERGAIRDEVARLDATAAKPWAEGDHWDDITYKGACALLDLAHSPWTALTVGEAEQLVRDHAPTDDQWTAQDVEEKIRSAHRTVSGTGRPAPVLTAGVDPFGKAEPCGNPEPMSDGGPLPTVPDATSEPAAAPRDEALKRLMSGGTFILDTPRDTPSIWGAGDRVLWAEGESAIICGPPGVGKTTLTGQVVRARIIGGTVLGLPVEPTTARVLYLAMDRPRQIARALRRTLGDISRDVLDERLVVWQGPPLADIAQHPETMIGLAQLAGADTIIVDSVKDAAVGLSNDEVGSGYNRARQMCIAANVQVLELHHMVKRGDNGSPPTSLADMYGSVWIGAGAGSVVNIHGAAGDPIVQMRHLKTPADEVGPYRLRHDHDLGHTEIFHQSDLIALAAASPAGITAKQAAQAVEDTDSPTPAQVEKARRKLSGLARAGHLLEVSGTKGGTRGGTAASWRAMPDHGPVSDHGSDHGRISGVPITQPHTDHAPAQNPRNIKGLSDHGSDHGDHAPTDHAGPPPFREGGSGAGEHPLRGKTPRRAGSRTTPIAGGRFAYDHQTGHLVDTQTGEITEQVDGPQPPAA